MVITQFVYKKWTEWTLTMKYATDPKYQHTTKWGGICNTSKEISDFNMWTLKKMSIIIVFLLNLIFLMSI